MEKGKEKTMITFKGTRKEFFKAYPKEKRSLKETYKLINSSGEVEYKFVAGLGEKCFKKIETNPETKDNKSNKFNNPDVFESLYDSVEIFEDRFSSFYESLNDTDIITDENFLSFEYIIQVLCGNFRPEFLISDYELFFTAILNKLKTEQQKRIWEKLWNSFKLLLCTK